MKLPVLLALCCIACGDDDVTLDASFDDAGVDAPTDASRPDAPADAPSDVRAADVLAADGDAETDSCRSIRDVSDLPITVDDARCEDGVAVVCASETSTWRRTTCGAGTQCETYSVTVYTNVGDDETPEYVPAFDTVGADCIPVGADACTWTIDERARITTDFEDGCTSDLRRECRRAHVEPVFMSGNGARASTERGWVLDTPCGEDESCRHGHCVDDDHVLCIASGFASTCTGDVLHTCLSGDPFDYEGDVDCAARGATCETTCGGNAACIDIDREPCDPETFVPVCEDADTITSCQHDCYTATGRCTEQFYEDRVVDTYCGTSYDVYAGRPDDSMAACLPEGVSTCVPSEFVERCDENTSVTCDGLVRRIECPADQECTLVDGNAGCAVSASASCTPGTGMPSCDGSLLVGCCEEGSDWVYGITSFWCQPGLLYTIEDCSEFGRSCFEDPIFGFVECR